MIIMALIQVAIPPEGGNAETIDKQSRANVDLGTKRLNFTLGDITSE